MGIRRVGLARRHAVEATVIVAIDAQAMFTGVRVCRTEGVGMRCWGRGARLRDVDAIAQLIPMLRVGGQ